MTDGERQRARAVAGWWSSTQEDVGFSASLKSDGTGVVVFGTPSETIKGPWWVASSPERIVMRRNDGTLVELKILQADAESMKLQSTAGGRIYALSKAVVVAPG